ncbi:MAG: hypothetical protein IPG04_40565 [Polyangiaceae bacterium]|nr:hypothetical protein [Polyangiaceae bacterium]
MRPASTRKTVARYHDRGDTPAFAKGRDITEDDVHAVAQVVQARPAPTASDEWSEVARHRDRIEQWLRGDAEKRPLPPDQGAHAARFVITTCKRATTPSVASR